MAPIPTKPAATPIIDETTTVGKEAKEEVSQGTQKVENWSRCRVEEGGSQVEHGMEANHTNRVLEFNNDSVIVSMRPA